MEQDGHGQGVRDGLFSSFLCLGLLCGLGLSAEPPPASCFHLRQMRG